MWVPAFECPVSEQRAQEPPDAGDYIAGFEGLRCYRIEDLGTPTELAEVLTYPTGALRHLARPGVQPVELLTAKTVAGKHLAGETSWRLAALAERVSTIDDHNIPHDPAAGRAVEITPGQARELSVSFRVREVPVTELRSL